MRLQSLILSRLLTAVVLLSASWSLPSCASGGSKSADSIAEAAIEARNDTIDMIFFGDAMQHGPQLQAALREGGGKSYDYSKCFSLIAPDIKQADYAVANLEVPLGGGPKYRGYPNFSSPDSYAQALKDAGFDMLLTANNHCLDSGDKAARRTLQALDSMKIDHIGTYHDAAQRAKLVPFIKEIKGTKIGFLNYTYGTNGIKPTAGMEVALIDREKIAQEMKATKQAGAEVLIVTVHWGVEYNQIENENQRQLADFMLANGADMIIGSHPHVVQPMKVVTDSAAGKKALVVYSLGNFISNQNDTDSRGGALVRTRLVRDADGKMKFHSADYDIFFTAKPEGANTNYRVVPSWQSSQIPAGQKKTFELFRRGALKIFDTYNIGVPRRHND